MKDLLEIPVPIYDLHVLVAFNLPARRIYQHVKKNGCSVGRKWRKEIKGEIDSGARGFCCHIGKGNSDIIIWLKKRLHADSTPKEWGTLAHEIYHAVARVGRFHQMENEEEALACLTDFLFQQVYSHCAK